MWVTRGEAGALDHRLHTHPAWDPRHQSRQSGGSGTCCGFGAPGDQGRVQATSSAYPNLESVKPRSSFICHPNVIQCSPLAGQSQPRTTLGREFWDAVLLLTELTRYKASTGKGYQVHEMSWGRDPCFLCCHGSPVRNISTLQCLVEAPVKSSAIGFFFFFLEEVFKLVIYLY